MKTLVLGGTGTVGSQVVRELVERDADVTILTRDASKPTPEGARSVVGNLQEPGTVRSVFDEIEAVFLLNAVSPSEAHEGLMAVAGARMADVERIVYLSVHNADSAPYLPHFGAKIPIEVALRSSGIGYTILRANNFFQNDYWFKDAILEHGVYPQPIGEIGLSRVDVRDIAEAAAISLLTDDHEGETYNVVGPHVLDGDATAAIWSEALGREIRYGGNDLDAWEAEAVKQMPEWMAFDFRLMYNFFQARGLTATEEDVERFERLLGRPPRAFQEFAQETAGEWLAD